MQFHSKTTPAQRTELPAPIRTRRVHPGVQGLPLTCQGLVPQKPVNLLLAVLLLLVGQQLVDKLPEDLLGWSVQHRVHIHNEGVDVPAKQEGRAGQ